MSPSEFIGALFLARDVAHRVHLSTRSFSKHSALGTFYEEIIPLADQWAEVYQGENGLLKGIPLMSAKSGNIIEFLKGQYKEIEEFRKTVECTPLQNIIDEIMALYLSTLYKLQFLA